MDRLRRRIIRWLGISFSDISGQITGSQIAPGAVTHTPSGLSGDSREILALEKEMRKMLDEYTRRESRPGGSMYPSRSLNDRRTS